MRILLVAEDAAGIGVLRALHQRGHEIVAVMAQPPAGRAGTATVWSVASHAGYRTWPAERVADPAFADVLADAGVDVLLNVYSLQVVHERILRTPPLGSFNLHPGPLPAYAGLNSVSWAILRGETSHGVTVHRMEALVDSGAIAYQETFPIADTDTGLTVSARCVRTGIELVLKLVDRLHQEPASLPLIEQDLARRTYFGAGEPRATHVSWTEPAASIVDYVRACDYYPLPSPWRAPTASLAGREVVLARVARTRQAADAEPGTVRTTGSGSLLVAASDEWVRLDQLRLEGHRVAASSALRTPVTGGSA